MIQDMSLNEKLKILCFILTKLTKYLSFVITLIKNHRKKTIVIKNHSF